jgi:NAD(P)-dependent dehydrogenase (short-subunit alcohol dehydrogenase family)
VPAQTIEPSPERARIVLVTGSSSGIGRACCTRLINDPSNRVYGASRTSDGRESWVHIPMDVTDDASVADGIARILSVEGRIDAVVHSAGLCLAGPIEDTSIAEAERQFDTNYFGTVRILRAVLPAMRQRRRGRIVVIGSIGGLIGLPFQAHYSATKFALDGLIEGLRGEIAPFAVEATILHPGHYATALLANRMLSASTTPGTPYFERFSAVSAFYDAAERAAGAPDAVAHRVARLLAQPGLLPVRVAVGSWLELGGIWAKALLPSRGFEALFRKAHSP